VERGEKGGQGPNFKIIEKKDGTRKKIEKESGRVLSGANIVHRQTCKFVAWWQKR